MDENRYSVESLKTIYAVIIALAISRVLINIFPGSNIEDYWPNLTNHAPAFFSFFLLIVPFYQGMNRHFSFCYLEKEGRIIDWALLIDFLIFAIEASLLFIFANSIKSGINSFVIIGLILFVDVIWGLVSHLIHYRKLNQSVINWSIINFIALVVGTLIFISSNIFIGATKEWVLFIVMLCRTVADYWTSWKFYFPSQSPKGTSD